jgi:hypothetical protein
MLRLSLLTVGIPTGTFKLRVQAAERDTTVYIYTILLKYMLIDNLG